MVSILEGGLAKTIGNAMASTFLPATLTRKIPGGGPPHDPAPPSIMKYSCRGMVETYSKFYQMNANASLIQTNDRKVLILASTLSTTPQEGDRITIQGVSFTVINVETDPATAVWTCQGRM